jgi:hypothetical protein
MNAFGIDVTGLDVDAFLLWAHRLYPLLALLWIAALFEVRRPGWLLVGVLLANAWLWGAINYPLQQIYALTSSADRLNQLGMVQVTAAGPAALRSFLIGPQVEQLHFEPFWSAFVAVLSGFDPERVLQLYPFLSLGTVLGFAVSLYYGLRPAPSGEGWSPWERAFVAGFATLLSSAPLEHSGIYRVPWTLTFLLKPNHALGLVLLPWLLRAFAGISGWRGRLLTGFLLHLLGWVFVLHMVYAVAGLVCLAVACWLWRKEARRDTLDTAAVIGFNLAIVSPYIAMLLIDYPFTVASPRLVVPASSAHVAEGTLRHAPMFLLGAWGALLAWRRDRLGRTWAAVVAAGLLIWLAYPLVGYLQLARERDEIYYWVRFTTAAMAGVGAWDLLQRLPNWLNWSVLNEVRRAALLAALALPFTIPAWLDPRHMDTYFEPSLSPLDEDLAIPTDFIRRELPRDAVFAGDPIYSRWVAALGARRGLLLAVRVPRDTNSRSEFVRELIAVGSSERLRATRWGATHLVVTRAFLEQFPGVSVDDLARRDDLELLLLHKRPRNYVAVFRLKLEH